MNNICVIAFPVFKSGVIPFTNLISILENLSNKLFIISSKTFEESYQKKNQLLKIYSLDQGASNNIIYRIINQISLQIQISIIMIKNRRDIDITYFFIGCEILLIPILISYILHKKIIINLPGSEVEVALSKKDKLVPLIRISSYLTKVISNAIVIYSSVFINTWNLQKFKNKIFIAPRHFVDFDKFKITKPYCERKKIIGYVGRLSHEKGIINLFQAIPLINDLYPDYQFVIIGDGELFEELSFEISKKPDNKNIQMLGWIEHNKLPDSLNEFKLLILPSFSEGLPNIILESMACGTPVLVTDVGAIPDIIKDEKNGYILSENIPQSIAEKTICILDRHDLHEIIENANSYVKQEFNFIGIQNNYQKMFDRILKT